MFSSGSNLIFVLSGDNEVLSNAMCVLFLMPGFLDHISSLQFLSLLN